MITRVAVAAGCLALVTVAAAGCTSSGAPRSSPPSAPPSSAPPSSAPAASTPGASTPVAVGAPTPLPAGKVTSTSEPCPWVGAEVARDAIGMRLGRLTVQRADGRVVGCRLYALQGSPLSRSENLPGPNQPAVQIVRTRYASPALAAQAVVAFAAKGANAQQDGAYRCYQVPFYPPDKGKDWACAFVTGSDAVVVQTVVTTPALSALQLTRQVRAGL